MATSDKAITRIKKALKLKDRNVYMHVFHYLNRNFRISHVSPTKITMYDMNCSDTVIYFNVDDFINFCNNN
jgi:hypothetical protein